jgi:hypothetical protein
LQDSLEVKEYPELGAEVYGLSFRSKDITEPLYDDIRPRQNNNYIFCWLTVR